MERKDNVMTMVREWKTCPKCGKKYSWNPDVGQFRCPYCGGLGNIDLLLKRKKKDK